MTEILRDRDYWEELAERTELGVLRYVPPDLDIPIPAECDRMTIRRACHRYLVANGSVEPGSDGSAMLGLRDRAEFSEFFGVRTDGLGLGLAPSLTVLGDASMAGFVVAVTGLALDDYVGVTYEDVVMTLNTHDRSTKEYIFMVETEYLAATELLYAGRRRALSPSDSGKG